MEFVALLIGAIIIVAAFNNSQDGLATQLDQDIPGFFKMGVAIAAVLALGYVPGLKTPSRYLIALVLIVIVMTNYSQILAGFQAFTSSSGAATGSGAANPSTAYATNPASNALPTAAEIAGSPGATSSSSTGTATAAANTAVTQGFASLGVPAGLNPGSYLAAFGA